MEVDKPAKKVKGQVAEASSDDESSEEESSDEDDDEKEIPKNKKKGKGVCYCLLGLSFVSSFVASR